MPDIIVPWFLPEPKELARETPVRAKFAWHEDC